MRASADVPDWHPSYGLAGASRGRGQGCPALHPPTARERSACVLRDVYEGILGSARPSNQDLAIFGILLGPFLALPPLQPPTGLRRRQRARGHPRWSASTWRDANPNRHRSVDTPEAESLLSPTREPAPNHIGASEPVAGLEKAVRMLLSRVTYGIRA
jgi:hypothetical protein